MLPSNILDSLNLAFVSVFTTEAAMKIISQPKQYWKSKWNVFDFLIVVGSVGGIVLDYATSLRIGPLVRNNNTSTPPPPTNYLPEPPFPLLAHNPIAHTP